MTSLNKLTQTDLFKLQTQSNTFKLTHVLFLICAILISLLAGLFGLKTFGFWKTALAWFIFMMLFYLIKYMIDFSSYKKDIKNQEKICATIIVLSKSDKRNDFVVSTDLKQLKKMNVFKEEIFNQIALSDKLYIEFTKQSKFLLKVEKNGNDLLHNLRQNLTLTANKDIAASGADTAQHRQLFR